MSNIRVRFAPSPTGFLHIGSLRSVLFNFLFARSNKGKFILRIEDTDEKRKVEGAVENLIEINNWLGIEFDEGPHSGGKYGPYIQSERKNIYKKYIDKLLTEKKAYRCFCTPERLDEVRKKQQANKEAPRYDRACRNLSENQINDKLNGGESFVVRQSIPLDGETKVKDILRGDIVFKNSELDDHVLMKSNSVPTYQFANVIDDHLMEISHVIRGDEWIPSLPKNILLYKDFDWAPPKYAHMPLTLNKEGGKLSKRQGDVTVDDYKKKGYLPEALINYGALLGWHPKDDNEILTINELIQKFNIEDMGTSPAIFDIEKLDFYNAHYIRQKSIKEIVTLCLPFLADNPSKLSDNIDKYTINSKQYNYKYIESIIKIEQERIKKLSDIKQLTHFFFKDELSFNPDLLLWKKLNHDQVKSNLTELSKVLQKVPNECWTEQSINDAAINHIKDNNLKVGDYLWPMRVALSGEKASPGPFEIAEILGKENSLRRMLAAISKL